MTSILGKNLPSMQEFIPSAAFELTFSSLAVAPEEVVGAAYHRLEQ